MELIGPTGCEEWRGALALRTLGDVDHGEETGLRAHLEGCGDCRSLAREMEETSRLLALVNRTDGTPDDAVSPALSARVLDGLRRAGERDRRRRRVRTAALGSAGLAAAAAIVVVVLAGGTGAPLRQRTVALRSSSSVRATAVLSSRSWGTSIALHEQGLPGGRAYTVSMESRDGQWWVAGSYRAVSGHSVDVNLACSVSLQRITGIRVTDGWGRTVLSSYRT